MSVTCICCGVRPATAGWDFCQACEMEELERAQRLEQEQQRWNDEQERAAAPQAEKEK